MFTATIDPQKVKEQHYIQSPPRRDGFNPYDKYLEPVKVGVQTLIDMASQGHSEPVVWVDYCCGVKARDFVRHTLAQNRRTTNTRGIQTIGVDIRPRRDVPNFEGHLDGQPCYFLQWDLDKGLPDFAFPVRLVTCFQGIMYPNDGISLIEKLYDQLPVGGLLAFSTLDAPFNIHSNRHIYTWGGSINPTILDRLGGWPRISEFLNWRKSSFPGDIQAELMAK